MEHKIPIAELNGPLPIPHLLQWPDYSDPNTFTAIVPEGMKIEEGDTFFKGRGADMRMTILERRPAKGDWSKQAVHKNPHFIKFIAK